MIAEQKCRTKHTRPFESVQKSRTQIIRVNVSKSDETFQYDFLVPGYSRDQISLDLLEGVLTLEISSENKLIANRQIRTPKNIDQDSLKAKLENGILNVQISEKEVQRKSIQVL